MPIPHWVTRTNRWLLNPLVLMFSSRVRPFATVHHVGRRSGRTHRVPVMAFRAPDAGERGVHVVIALTYGRYVDWVRNVEAAGRCEITRGGFRYVMTGIAHVGGEEALPAFPPLARRVLGAIHVDEFLTGRVTPFADAPGEH